MKSWWALALCCVVRSADFVANDPELIYEAARAVDQEVPWAAASKMLRGCVSDISPLTVTIEYKHRDDAGPRIVRTFRPWRSDTWRMLDDADSFPCGLDAYVTEAGRARHITEVTRHAWNGYYQHARGHDTLAPLSQTGVDDYGGISITAIDSLDTLWLMGLHKEFEEACAIVNDTRFDVDVSVNVFETTIRAIGGLLSAHTLSGRTWLLKRAMDLGSRLLPAFKTYGIPQSDVNLLSGRAQDPAWQASSLSEAALTLEFRELARLSNDTKFSAVVERADRRLRAIVEKRGDPLLPCLIVPGATLNVKGDVKLGARADSYYEYLLKEWARSGDSRYRDAFTASARAIRERLHRAVGDDVFVGELHNGNFAGQMDHLVCFWPGVLALAIKANALSNDPFMDDARRITRACARMHRPYDLAPEITKFEANRTFITGADVHNLLRPETLESLYVMWCVEGDNTYRELSWTVFDHLERAARVDGGYATIKDVTKNIIDHYDQMPSYFLAETLKYAWLSASELDVISTHVLTTEGHILSRTSDKRNL